MHNQIHSSLPNQNSTLRFPSLYRPAETLSRQLLLQSAYPLSDRSPSEKIPPITQKATRLFSLSRSNIFGKTLSLFFVHMRNLTNAFYCCAIPALLKAYIHFRENNTMEKMPYNSLFSVRPSPLKYLANF